MSRRDGHEGGMTSAGARLEAWVLVLTLLAAKPAAGAAPLVFERLTGPPTSQEVTAFKAWAGAFRPDSSNEGDAWAQGHSGQALQAMGLMYEMTGDPAILGRMLAVASAGLAERNDLAPPPVGHLPLWPGADTPAWGNRPHEEGDAGHAGPETGLVVGRIAYAAYLALRTPALAGEVVPDGDPHHFGLTFGERARALVRRLDETEDRFILRWFVRRRDRLRFYYPTDRRYANLSEGGNAGNPVPWNQQMMIGEGLMRLAQCHQLLGDDPERVATYDGCVRSSIQWLLSRAQSHRDPRVRGAYYTWHYSTDDFRHVEDSTHAGLDEAGLCLYYGSGRYSDVLSRANLLGFANDFVDVVARGGRGFAGTVDGGGKRGHAAMTDFPRPNSLLLLEFRPDAFRNFVAAALAAKRTRGDVTAITNLLWVRYRLSAAVR